MKLIFTGPECTGKSYFSSLFSIKYNLPLVDEQSRAYLCNTELPYNETDVRKIGCLQIEAESAYFSVNKNIVCDTDILTILIWQMEKYGHWDTDFYNIWKDDNSKYYILCSPDIPWQSDPLRENPTDRLRLFDIYHEMLTKENKNFIILHGSEKEKQVLLDSLISMI